MVFTYSDILMEYNNIPHHISRQYFADFMIIAINSPAEDLEPRTIVIVGTKLPGKVEMICLIL
jgi:hypothetical protein